MNSAENNNQDGKHAIPYNKLKPVNALEKSRQYASQALIEENLRKLDSTHLMNKSVVQNEIQNLIKLLERDQVEKEVGNILKSCFLSWNYTEEGFADKIEFEEKLKKYNLLLSTKTLDKLFSWIISKKNVHQVSFIKVKQICEELKKRIKLSKDEFHAKDLMYGKITTKENFLDHPLINFLEIKMEEKYKTIHDAFRIFDENGDSKLTFSEFEKGMLHLNTDLTKDDIRKAFDLLDENKNGELEYHEFCECFDGYKRRGNPLVTSQQTKDISSGMMKLSDLDKKYKRNKNIKYEPPSLYGISNSGMSNPLTNRLQRFRQSDNVSGFGSKSSRIMDFNNDTHNDRYSTMEDILSQASVIRSKMNLPTPKNKNPEMFIQDISDSGKKKRSIIYKRNKHLTAGRTYGHKEKASNDMGELINHEYMNNFTQRIQEKSDKMRRENQAKIRRLKNFADYKVNNTVLKRSSEIKKHYLSGDTMSKDASKQLSSRKQFFSPQKEKSEFYRKLQSPSNKNFIIDATRLG